MIYVQNQCAALVCVFAVILFGVVFSCHFYQVPGQEISLLFFESNNIHNSLILSTKHCLHVFMNKIGGTCITDMIGLALIA